MIVATTPCHPAHTISGRTRSVERVSLGPARRLISCRMIPAIMLSTMAPRKQYKPYSTVAPTNVSLLNTSSRSSDTYTSSRLHRPKCPSDDNSRSRPGTVMGRYMLTVASTSLIGGNRIEKPTTNTTSGYRWCCHNNCTTLRIEYSPARLAIRKESILRKGTPGSSAMTLRTAEPSSRSGTHMRIQSGSSAVKRVFGSASATAALVPLGSPCRKAMFCPSSK